jgi:hypothetical protein
MQKCLMKEIILFGKMSCRDLNRFAHDTQLKCYTEPHQPSKSICDIPTKQNVFAFLKIFKSIDFYDSDHIKRVGIHCFRELL